MTPRHIFLLILGVDALILFLQTSELSISYYEASLLYGNFSFMQAIIKTSLNTFGQNDLALRLPMIVLHILSVFLLNEISKKYLDNAKDRLWLIMIFILLPGVISSALLVSSAGLVIFGLLLFIYIYNDFSKKTAYILLIAFALVDMKFLYLFLSLSIFSIFIKDKFFLIFNILLATLSVYLYGFDTQGLPTGHFLDSIGIYSAIFTPIIFVYIVYALYRRYLIKKIDILWFISSVTFVISLILSFRQRVDVENFAPYLIVALPIAAKIFSSSYKVRLKQFRKKYKFIFVISLIFLLFNTIVVLFNKELYLVLNNPQKHFAYKMHIAKELATELKSRNIYCVDAESEMSKRLRFYGITKCETYLLKENKFEKDNLQNVTIRYRDKIIYSANVTKLNNK
jgi:hypothetical protein